MSCTDWFPTVDFSLELRTRVGGKVRHHLRSTPRAQWYIAFALRHCLVPWSYSEGVDNGSQPVGYSGTSFGGENTLLDRPACLRELTDRAFPSQFRDVPPTPGTLAVTGFAHRFSGNNLYAWSHPRNSMVTLGSIQPTNFQAFHAGGPYDDTLNFRSFELALNDVPDINTPHEDVDSPEEKAQELRETTHGGLMAPFGPASRSGRGEEVLATATAALRGPRLSPAHGSSTSDRLPRRSEQEQQSWHPPPPGSDEPQSVPICLLPRADRCADSRLRASSWHAADMRSRRSPPLTNGSTYKQQQGACFSPRSPKRDGGHLVEDEKPTNEILDGSDVLQQISNVTSTEPSNEREVFVGGLRESEDSVHITEEELATYFSKFGIIESVSINRDDRTHRGRGFAFVKFFQEVSSCYSWFCAVDVLRG